MSEYKALFLLFVVLLAGGVGVSAQPRARKFDELTWGTGSPEPPWRVSHEEARKEFELRIARYAKQLRKEKARPYVIAYGPRVVERDNSNASIGDMRAGQARSELLGHGFDSDSVKALDGGFREAATTELWIVPPGAQPPSPSPTVRPEDVARCPFVRVVGPAYVPRPGGPVTFKAEVESNDPKIRPTFGWKVSAGRIAGGGGTGTIEVELPEAASGDVVARVDVGGYSLECPAASTAATRRTTFGADHFKADEYGDICSGDEKARLDNLAIELQSDPELQAHVVYYGGRCYSSCNLDYPLHRPRLPRRGEADKRAARIKNYLTETRGLDPERVVVVNGGHRESWTAELWLVPRGRTPPAPTPTLQPEDIRYGKGSPTRREFRLGCMGG